MKFMVYLCLVGLAALSFITAIQNRQITDGRKSGRTATCTAFSTLDSKVIKSIQEGEKTLPTFQYFQNHPADLAKTVKSDENAIAAIESSLPTYCPKDK